METTEWLTEMVVQYVWDTLHLAVLYNLLLKYFIILMENGYIPDILIRYGIQFLLSKRLNKVATSSLQQLVEEKMAFVEQLKQMPLAIHTDDANEQHYEVPTIFYLLVLGMHLKYSSCLYKTPYDSLNQAEENMLLTCVERAKLIDGQDILELGCGWGSFCLFAAARFPNSRITAVSNSATQREFITSTAQERGLTNLKVITANVVKFAAPGKYDRIVSIEMFEHMKNYQELFRRCSSWLKPGGLLFVHVFCHRSHPYHFEVHSEEDWMSKYFFTGGTMPSLDLFHYFQDHVKLEKEWYVNGKNYSRTLEAWLKKQDAHTRQVMVAFEGTYGKANALLWFNRWRVFFLACSELFKFKNGEEWGVAHYLFSNRIE